MRNAKLFNFLHLHLIVFILGFTAILGSLISVSALPLVWFRMSLATMIIILFLWWKKKNLIYAPKAIAGFAIAGVIIALHWLAFFSAIKISNVSITLAVMSTGAFFTSLLEPLIFRRRIILYEVFFGLLAMLGLALIFSFETTYTSGILLALLAAFLGASFTIMNGNFVQKHEATIISFYELLAGVIAITVYLALSGSFKASFFILSVQDWWYIFILATICTAYAFVASTHVMKWLSPYTVMLTINLEPVYGIILALFILGDSENMSPQFYYGGGLILITVLANGFVKMRIRRKKKGFRPNK